MRFFLWWNSLAWSPTYAANQAEMSWKSDGRSSKAMLLGHERMGWWFRKRITGFVCRWIGNFVACIKAYGLLSWVPLSEFASKRFCRLITVDRIKIQAIRQTRIRIHRDIDSNGDWRFLARWSICIVLVAALKLKTIRRRRWVDCKNRSIGWNKFEWRWSLRMHRALRKNDADYKKAKLCWSHVVDFHTDIAKNCMQLHAT